LDTFTTPQLAQCHEKAIISPVARICVSDAVASEVRAGWGLKPAVIPNGVDSARYILAGAEDAVASKARDRWRERFGSYVLAVGGIEPRKGSLDLLEAFSLLRARHPRTRLVFAGGETLFDYRDYRAAFDERARELGVQYTALGVVPEEDMPSLVAASSAFSFVSTKEGFGLAAMEALASGVPVVARDLPVLREVLGDSVLYASDPSGIAVALSRCLTGRPIDPARGVRLAQRYSWDDAAARHLEFYSQLTGGTPHGKPARRPASAPKSRV
jgi:glycosyltransferase-like protein